MTTKAITTEEEYDAALARLDELFELHRNKEEQAEIASAFFHKSPYIPLN